MNITDKYLQAPHYQGCFVISQDPLRYGRFLDEIMEQMQKHGFGNLYFWNFDLKMSHLHFRYEYRPYSNWCGLPPDRDTWQSWFQYMVRNDVFEVVRWHTFVFHMYTDRIEILIDAEDASETIIVATPMYGSRPIGKVPRL